MSARSFFNLRYSIPGYLFLIFAVITYPGVFQDISNIAGSELMGVILGVMSGPALGFLISQIWYTLVYNRKKMNIYKSNKELRKYLDYLHKDHYIKKDDPDVLEYVCNYLYCHYDNDRLIEYGNRRWDLFRIMGISKISIIMGIAISIALLLVNKTICVGKTPIWVIASLIIGVFFSYIFKVSMIRLEKEHDNIVYIILYDLLNGDKRNIINKFPTHFYYDKEDANDQSV